MQIEMQNANTNGFNCFLVRFENEIPGRIFGQRKVQLFGCQIDTSANDVGRRVAKKDICSQAVIHIIPIHKKKIDRVDAKSNTKKNHI